MSWAAGFLEGTAFFYGTGDGMAMRIAMDKRVSGLTRFCAIFSIRIGREARIILMGRKLALVLYALWPYLSVDTKREIRRIQAEVELRVA